MWEKRYPASSGFSRPDVRPGETTARRVEKRICCFENRLSGVKKKLSVRKKYSKESKRVNGIEAIYIVVVAVLIFTLSVLIILIFILFYFISCYFFTLDFFRHARAYRAHR